MQDYRWLHGRVAELSAAVSEGDRCRAEQLVAHTRAEGGLEAAEFLLVELLMLISGQAQPDAEEALGCRWGGDP
ncbi:hypothetical protein [Crossiella cryophila]|uniref:Uncharacterized protein n=1 Tax=Crossiella cryophila TaxID=43355 RepID=A0A7W7CEU5_9PSEU|nr:hypothetical protein [Crossiella cryophila]MBB4679856.1 hypothetical protein [Crossiella cryophila]